MHIKSDIAISESGFVFNPATGESFTVNPIGAEVIQLLKDNKSIQEAIEFILERYNVDETSFEKDLNDFVAMLKHHSILMHDE
ncbi:MAG: HPr-rel-A system PqqD family protein [Marinilabiliales bacterium]|nr:MAG: HPr-rel-A system PqqD family protein [Marinilabiliales bacterium]